MSTRKLLIRKYTSFMDRAENIVDCYNQLDKITTVQEELRYNDWLNQEDTDRTMVLLTEVRKILQSNVKRLI